MSTVETRTGSAPAPVPRHVPGEMCAAVQQEQHVVQHHREGGTAEQCPHTVQGGSVLLLVLHWIFLSQ